MDDPSMTSPHFHLVRARCPPTPAPIYKNFNVFHMAGRDSGSPVWGLQGSRPLPDKKDLRGPTVPTPPGGRSPVKDDDRLQNPVYFDQGMPWRLQSD